MKYLLLILLVISIAACKKNKAGSSLPACLQLYIDSATISPKGTMAISIDAYTWQNKTVYIYFADCCDRYNTLKDENCSFMFYPSGGFTGGGDGSHPNFFNEAVFIKNIWTDPRH